MDDCILDDAACLATADYDYNTPYSPSSSTIIKMEKEPTEWTLDDISHMSFQSVDEAHYFYNEYALLAGFSIRKDKIVIDGDMIKMRKWLCSKAGFRRPKVCASIEEPTRRARYETRCGCSAAFKIKLSPTNLLYYPVQFNTTHNHELAPSNCSHFLLSHRKVDATSAHQIAQLREAGVKPSQIMNILVNQWGGYERVGFTRRDLYNHVYRTTSARDISNECELALHYIRQLAISDPGVVCRVHSEDDGMVSRIFFADSISRTEYDVFGDVVLCDATYKTNRLRLPLVLLLGVDNHFKTIVFACALVCDETKETYQWVYETFISCMGKAPGVILTDRDKAMHWAVEEVMPRTRHRLCTWHIMRNLAGVCSNRAFEHELDKLMTKRYPVAEFTKRWNTFLEKYRLDSGNRRWVTDLKSTVSLWAESHFHGVFTVGLHTNQRAESTNSTLKSHVDVSLSIAQFFHKYFVFLDEIRQAIMKQECINSQCTPANLNYLFKSIRSQIAAIYTLAAYNKVHEQMMQSQAFTCDPYSLVADITRRRYRVLKFEAEDSDSKAVMVTCDQRDFSFQCECEMMDSMGLPCKHMFALIKHLRVRQLSPSNLCRRWMKDARQYCFLSSSCREAVQGTANRLCIIRPQCERLAYLSSLGDKRMVHAMQEINHLNDQLDTFDVQRQPLEPHTTDTPNHSNDAPLFRDPPVVRTKGAPRLHRASTPKACGYCKMPGHTKPTCELWLMEKGNNSQAANWTMGLHAK